MQAWHGRPHLWEIPCDTMNNELAITPRGGDNETPMSETLGQMLKRLIIEAGTTPEKLAEALGYEPSISAIKKLMAGGVPNPRVRTLERIAVGLGVQPEILWRAAVSGELGDDVNRADMMSYEIFVKRYFANDKETRDKLLSEYRWIQRRHRESDVADSHEG